MTLIGAAEPRPGDKAGEAARRRTLCGRQEDLQGLEHDWTTCTGPAALLESDLLPTEIQQETGADYILVHRVMENPKLTQTGSRGRLLAEPSGSQLNGTLWNTSKKLKNVSPTGGKQC